MPNLTEELRGIEKDFPPSSSIESTVSFLMKWKLYRSPAEITDLLTIKYRENKINACYKHEYDN